MESCQPCAIENTDTFRQGHETHNGECTTLFSFKNFVKSLKSFLPPTYCYSSSSASHKGPPLPLQFVPTLPPTDPRQLHWDPFCIIRVFKSSTCTLTATFYRSWLRERGPSGSNLLIPAISSLCAHGACTFLHLVPGEPGHQQVAIGQWRLVAKKSSGFVPSEILEAVLPSSWFLPMLPCTCNQQQWPAPGWPRARDKSKK